MDPRCTAPAAFFAGCLQSIRTRAGIVAIRRKPMSLNVPLLRSSFELVVERQPQLTHRFYEILLARYTEAEQLFVRHSSAAQEKMLTDALVAVMDHLEDAP